jgi:hypothetical protein
MIKNLCSVNRPQGKKGSFKIGMIKTDTFPTVLTAEASMYIMVLSSVAAKQGDQIGRIFAHWLTL